MGKIEILRYEVEMLPERKLVGKCYTNGDRDEHGSFAQKWDEWIETESCLPLAPLLVDAVSNDILGFMRMNNGVFEYWIGYFCLPDAIAPPGYSELMLPPSKMAVVYLRGKNGDREIYGMYDACVAYLQRQGVQLGSEFHLERYSRTRFSNLDSEGCIILDYGFAIQ